MVWGVLSTVSSLVAGGGTCVAAIATWRTVTEMKRQWEAAWRPDITCVLPAMTSAMLPCLKICNVGLGVAKKLHIELSMPFESFLPELNKIIVEDDIKIDIEDGQMKFVTHSEDGSISVHGYSILCAADILYLLPGSDNAVEISLPAYFEPLIKFIADLYKNNNRKNLSGVINKLSLIISGTFIDLGDKQHTVKIVNSMHSIFYTKDGYIVKFTQ